MNYKKAKVAILGLFLLGSLFVSTNTIAKEEKSEEIKAIRDDYVELTLSANEIYLLLDTTDFVSDSAIVNVKTSHYSGYTLSFNTKNDYNDLKNPRNETQKIPSITVTSNASNFPTLGWGYAFDGDADFKEIPINNSNLATTSTNGSQNYQFTAGARVDGSLAQGSYENVLTFTAIANPLTVALCNPAAIDITEAVCMQDINADILSSMEYSTIYALFDARDQKKYWITRSSEDEVIMVQNLDLELNPSMTLTSDLTDLNSRDSWTPNIKVVDDLYSIWGDHFEEAEAEGKFSTNKAIFYELGDYYYYGYWTEFGKDADGNIVECHNGDCDDTIIPKEVNNPLEYGWYFTDNARDTGEYRHIGNAYSTAAVFAVDNLDDLTDKIARDSICPRGWTIPTFNVNTTSNELIHAPYMLSYIAPGVAEYATHYSYSKELWADYSRYLGWDSETGEYLYDNGRDYYAPMLKLGKDNSRVYNNRNSNYAATYSVRCSFKANTITVYYYTPDDYFSSTKKYTTNSYDTIKIIDTIPNKSGYRFLGWSLDENSTTPDYQPGEEITIIANGSKELYAIWEEI